jgi:hypothetical protein
VEPQFESKQIGSLNTQAIRPSLPPALHELPGAGAKLDVAPVSYC